MALGVVRVSSFHCPQEWTSTTFFISMGQILGRDTDAMLGISCLSVGLFFSRDYSRGVSSLKKQVRKDVAAS